MPYENKRMKRWAKRGGLDSRPAHKYRMIVDQSIKLRIPKAEQSLTLVIPECLLCSVSLVRVERV